MMPPKWVHLGPIGRLPLPAIASAVMCGAVRPAAGAAGGAGFAGHKAAV